MDAAASWVRAEIRLALGDEAGALADSELTLDFARDAQDPQVLFPSLALHARILLAAGRRSEAVRFVDELLELVESSRSGFISYWAMPLAFVLTDLGRNGDLERVIRHARLRTGWGEAADAYGKGALVESADVLAEMGAVSVEAFVRLRAADAFVQAGRRAEADAQLQQALAFYRSVGATAYIQEAEGLFAASA
jgi:tetratricopeptide (TPR) repeat protein